MNPPTFSCGTLHEECAEVMLRCRSLVVALRSAARSRAALHLESLALRHQLAVLNRSRPPRLRLTAADRVLWAWLSQGWSCWRPALGLV